MISRSCAIRSEKGFFRSQGGAHRGGFTLLEICIVLLVLAVLMGVIVPGMQSALNEQGIRTDARQLSLLIKTAVQQSNEEHGTYRVELGDGTVLLERDQPASTLQTISTQDEEPTMKPEVLQSFRLSTENRLSISNTGNEGDCKPVASAEWVFRAGELCPVTWISLERGKSRLDLDFNALTGDVDEERSYFP